MRARYSAFAVLLFLATLRANASDCVAIEHARDHVGEVKCISGKVLRVATNGHGTHFLDFCADAPTCPFSVVVFAYNLRDVGDVRQLAGRTIEIRGPVKLYDGRAEIVLRRVSQLNGGARAIPPVPKAYDVETRGHYSAGRFRPGSKPKKTTATPKLNATYGNEEENEEP